MIGRVADNRGLTKVSPFYFEKQIEFFGNIGYNIIKESKGGVKRVYGGDL